MFDAETSRLIRAAPALRGVASETLPQDLTGIYAELVSLRLREDELTSQPDRMRLLERLGRIATIYETLADTGAESEPRRAAAFVAGTAHQMLGKVMAGAYDGQLPLLSPSAIHPLLAAPLLFLVAEQNADAREAAKALRGVRDENVLKSALIETVYDLTAENFQEILDRAARLRQIRAPVDAAPEVAIEQALYGLCWSGIVQMVGRLLSQEVPHTAFLGFESPQQAFDRVVELSIDETILPIAGGHLVSVYGGPRHLARLLRHVADGLEGAGIVGLPAPGGAHGQFWGSWLRHRAKSKPILWRNHREALATGFLDQGNSAVLVLPTGAGKTTLSELKVASALAAGKTVIFLVPTLALVDQLRDELADSFPPTIGNIEVAADGDLMGLFLMPQLRSIEVMTPERCLALMGHTPDALSDVGLVVFDECHLLSPQGGGTRSLDAMLCLLQALKRAPEADFLLLSAMVTNADDLAAWIAEISERPCIAFQNAWKPSRQARGVVVYPQQGLVEIFRSARAARTSGTTRARLKKDAVPFALFGLHQNWNPQAPADTRLIKLLETSVDLAVNAQGRPTPNANAVAGKPAISAAVAGLKTIIFVQQPSHAVTTARKIADELTASIELTTTEESLWDGIQAELGGAQYSLVKPTSAALPHNGDMIPLERRLAESLFRRDNGASIIVATPTLAQGMNLPAQLAILAGDKRHDDSGRSALAAHEILNAAGRAGRAGHLANGVVLMIPEPVLSFSSTNTPDSRAFDKLRTLLPANDRCVILEDPITAVLDRIQSGNASDLQVRYFISRVQAAEDPEQATDNVLNMVQRSFSRFLAIRTNQQETFELKVEALRSMLSLEGPVEPNVAAVAASHGLAPDPLAAIQTRLQANLSQLPTTIIGWTDWLIDFFESDRPSYAALMERDASTALAVMRGSKIGGPLTGQEFNRLKTALRLWMQGRPYVDIERALGATGQTIKSCPRARDLILKLTNRRLYLILSAVGAVANQVYEANASHAPQPAVLETLAVAVRKGFDTPDKVAYDHIQQTVRSRVMLHAAFYERFATPLALQGQPYEVVLDQVNTRLAFSG